MKFEITPHANQSKRNWLERHLPRGTRRIAAAIGLATSELLTNQIDDNMLQAADSLGDAQEQLEEERKENLQKEIAVEKRISQDRIEEVRKRISKKT